MLLTVFDQHLVFQRLHRQTNHFTSLHRADRINYLDSGVKNFCWGSRSSNLGGLEWMG
jgi:hypothetical protein